MDCGVFCVLNQYADEIGLPYSTLIGYRNMALAWPKEKRNPAVSFSIHRALDALEERFDLIFHSPKEIGEWTLDKALRYAKRRPDTPETQDERIDRVQALLRDEEIASAAVVELVQRPQVAERAITDSRVRHSLLSDDDNAAEAVAEVLQHPRDAERLMADSEIRHSLLNNDDNAAAAVAEVVQRPKVAERVMDDSRSRSSLYRANMNRLTPSDPTAPAQRPRGAAKFSNARGIDVTLSDPPRQVLRPHRQGPRPFGGVWISKRYRHPRSAVQ